MERETWGRWHFQLVGGFYPMNISPRYAFHFHQACGDLVTDRIWMWSASLDSVPTTMCSLTCNLSFSITYPDNERFFSLPVGIQLWCASVALGRVHGELLYGHQKIRPQWRVVRPSCCTQTPQQVRLHAIITKLFWYQTQDEWAGSCFVKVTIDNSQDFQMLVLCSSFH